MQFHTTGIVLAALTVVSAASAQTTQAVEWKVSEGGNGHWYCTITRPEGFTRPQAQNHSASLGGHLFTGCGAEFSTAISLANALSPSFWDGNPAGGSHRIGPWIGLAWSSVGTWYWIDGSDCLFDGWDSAYRQPDNAGEDSVLLYSNSSTPAAVCHDIRGSIVSPSYILEYDTDCNADGIVDYGQILRGELIDLNANGVPDICETSVSSVIPPSVPSQGGSTVTIRGNGFQDNPTVRIGGVPATNIARVSLTEITATSPALLPGMASVQVNDFTLQDGIYIRPDCGSDLDQNGAVDGGDMAILLLDWGPCYTTPSALAAPAPTPLLVPDESTPASTPPAPQSARPTPQPRGTAS
jgi:hypothetical protein